MPDSCFLRGLREWWFEPRHRPRARCEFFKTETISSFSFRTGAGHHWLFEMSQHRPKEMSTELEVRAKNMQVDSGEFDVQAGKEKQSWDCHDKTKTLLAQPEGNQQAMKSVETLQETPHRTREGSWYRKRSDCRSRCSGDNSIKSLQDRGKSAVNLFGGFARSGRKLFEAVAEHKSPNVTSCANQGRGCKRDAG